MSHLSLPSRVLRVVQYLHHLVYERKVSTGVVEACLLSVRYYLLIQGRSGGLFDDPYLMQMIRTAKKAASKLNPTVKKVSLLPASIEMVELSRHSACLSDATQVYRMCDLAFRAGWFLGNRPSELAPATLTDHQLLGINVSFHLQDRSQFNATQSCMQRQPLVSPVQCVRFYWPTTKTAAKTLYITGNSDIERQVIADLFSWSVHYVRVGSTPFFSFSRDQSIKSLTRDLLAQHVKSLAGSFNLDVQRFSAKSMRIGAATDLSTRGSSKADIDKACAWSTKASTSLKYTRPTPKLGVQGVLCVDDLRVMQLGGAVPVVPRGSLAHTCVGGSFPQVARGNLALANGPVGTSNRGVKPRSSPHL
jgi:hypothetical protein